MGRRLSRSIVGAALLALVAVPPATATEPVMRFAERQLARADAEVSAGRYPSHTKPSGRWAVTGPEAWTSGFLPGAMWLAYRHTRDPVWRRRAARRQGALGGQRLNTRTHDVGFIMLSSYVRAWALTRRPAYRRIALRAAGSLASRFNPRVGATRSWGRRRTRRFTVIVDNLMNLELLFWADRHGGRGPWSRIAHRHALTTLRDHVRPDGSTYHVVDYDGATGRVIGKRTVQGAFAESTWSRGQAWAINGFATAYRYTRDARLLRAARRVARWWSAHVPPGGVPPWDFDAPSATPALAGPFDGVPRPARDSSAASIAASGLLALARLEPDPASARRFRATARSTLRTLRSRRYLARGTRSRSILLHGTANHPGGLTDTGLIYGDYYFLEALARLASSSRARAAR
ncbi:MAG: glycoside hydrolase family 88 protein [Actinomycetota bacterium]|nr:glycoside hydrolase family 88 protein [Actinomycetota bacterium]